MLPVVDGWNVDAAGGELMVVEERMEKRRWKDADVRCSGWRR